MSAFAPEPLTPLPADDAALIQRVVGHVLESQAGGALPRMPWHHGLQGAERSALRARWPVPCALWDTLDVAPESSRAPADDQSLLRALHGLFIAHRVNDDPVTVVLANALVAACFGSHHLWQDLGATGREEVTRLIKLGFPGLHASNHRNLRWKRHLFIVLGERLGRDGLRPPKCNDCNDYDVCFGEPAALAGKTWPMTPLSAVSSASGAINDEIDLAASGGASSVPETAGPP